MRTAMRLLIVVCVLSGSFTYAGRMIDSLETTTSGDTSLGEKIVDNLEENIKISGELGAFGELYSVDGRESRRPGQTGRLFFKPSVSLYDRITLSLDLFLSTEGNAARQEINTVGFSPEWSWGKLYYGDFTMEVSKFSLTDVKINGYGIDLFPGSFKLQMVSGKTQKALALESTTSMYERTLYGGKIGFGEISGSHFHLNFIRSYDNLNSLSRDIFRKVDTVSTSQGLRIDTSYVGTKPQENMIVGTNLGLDLFDGTIKMKTEASVSMFTADMYSEAINNEEIPSEVGKYFTPRITSSADAAVETEMQVNTRYVNVKSGYTLVGPGYTSLGMGSLINDRQIITGAVGLNLFSGGLNIQTNFQRHNDNTANQKLFTLERNLISFVVAMRPWKPLSVTVLSNSNIMSNNATNDTLKVDNTNSTLGVSSSLNFPAFSVDHVLTASYTGVTNSNKNKIRGNNEVTATNINIGFNTTYSKTISSSIGLALSSVDLGPVLGSSSTQTYNGRLSHKAFDSKLTNSLSLSSNSSSASTSTQLGFQSSYRLFEQSSIALNFRGMFFKGKGTSNVKFNEYTTTLNWSYRFN